MRQPFSSTALAPGDLQQLLIKTPKGWWGLRRKLLSTLPFFVVVDHWDYTTAFWGGLGGYSLFSIRGPQQISAIHAEGSWDVVNQWRGLWIQWAVLLLVWPERFKTLWLLTPFSCWQLSSTQPKSTNKSLMYHSYPRELCQRVFNSGIQVRASDNIRHSF